MRPDILTCDECGSEYKKGSSEMMSICPECAHRIYGYPACLREAGAYTASGTGRRVNIRVN